MTDDPDRDQALYRAIQRTSEVIDEIIFDPRKQEEWRDRADFWTKNVHHYTDLNAASFVVASGNVWLTDARYCNDRREIDISVSLIQKVFQDILGQQRINGPQGHNITLFSPEVNDLGNALAGYLNNLATFTAYVCCFCAAKGNLARPQDILSQWRGYGSNGRGACVSFNAGSIEFIINQNPIPSRSVRTSMLPNRNQRLNGLLFEPVLYDITNQETLINRLVYDVVDDARNNKRYINQQHLIDALLMITPLMKHPGFSEEKEWRLVCLPTFLAGGFPPCRASAPVPISLSRISILIRYLKGPSWQPKS
jgi:hypothetical protein